MPVQSEHDVVKVRRIVRQLTQELAFSLVDQTKMVTAASELARNTLVHGRGGELLVEVVQEGMRTGLRLTFADRGPGIADVKLAMTDGWTSAEGLGLGLSGAKRLVNDFQIDTAPGQGTRVTVVRWK